MREGGMAVKLAVGVVTHAVDHERVSSVILAAACCHRHGAVIASKIAAVTTIEETTAKI
jgi:hypothetical protein